MKKIIKNTLALILFANFAFGQVDSLKQAKSTNKIDDNSKNKTEYIFNSKNCKINSLGLYFSPEIGVSQLNSKSAPLGGGSFMLLINKKLGIGFSGYMTGSSNNKNELLNLGYGGIKLEYTVKPNAKFHTTFPLLIGTGFANIDSTHQRGNFNRQPRGPRQNGNWGGGGPERNNFGNQYFIIQPGVNVEGNLMKYIKIFAGLNYRIATKINNDQSNNTNLAPIKPSQVSGITATIGLKFGLFDYQLHKRDSLFKRNRKEYRHNR